jgi:N-acetylglutamate synthase-like GNAT family acetyltransferase
VTLRDAIPADAPAIAALLDELGYPSPEPAVAARLARFAADPRARVIVAEADGEVAGVIATHVVPRIEDDAPTCRIIAIVVAGRHRRAGVATELLAAAEAEARAHGARRLDLSSADWRADAHAFYERCGFERRAQAFIKRLD